MRIQALRHHGVHALRFSVLLGSLLPAAPQSRAEELRREEHAVSAAQQATQAESVPSVTAGPQAQNQDFEILSDTRGVDFAPYVQTALGLIFKIWLPLLPAEARAPSYARGETVLRFTVGPDGQITAMHLDASTHNDNLNRAAWGAIAGVQRFPPLPGAFDGPNLELRIRFKVNQPRIPQ